MDKSLLRLLSSAFVFLSSVGAQAAPPNDFDADGTSDVTFYSTSGSGYQWSSVPSGAGAAVDEIFALSTDSVALGSWELPSSPLLGVLRVSSSKSIVNWRILKEGGLIVTRSFGRVGSTFLSGGDFNGDGVADVAAVSHVNGRLKWRIRLGIFTESPSTATFFLGRVGDRVTYLSVIEGRDSAGAFGLAPNGRKGRLITKTIGTSGVQTYRGYPKALTAGQRPRPVPIANESGLDNLMFAVEDDSDTNIKVFSVAGELISDVTLSGQGTAVVGEYDSESDGEEVLFQADSTLRSFNPVTESVEDIDNVSGTIISEFNVTSTVAATPTPTATPEVE